MPQDLAFLQDRELHLFGEDLQEHCYLIVTRPQEQRL